MNVAANDNLPDAVSGVGDWIPLCDAVERVVEACARERAASHQVENSGRDHSERLSLTTLGRSARKA